MLLYVLALLNAGVAFNRMTSILSDFDKMTCLCMVYLDFRDPLDPYFASFFIDLHVLFDLGERRVYN